MNPALSPDQPFFDNRVSSSSRIEHINNDGPMSFTSSCMRDMGREKIEIVERGLLHALYCPRAHHSCCLLCTRMKFVISHTRKCVRRRREVCEVCSTVVSITVFHARVCDEEECQIPFCHEIRDAMETYSAGSYHLYDLDHLVHRVVRRLQDLSPDQQLSDEEDGEAEVAGDQHWNYFKFLEQDQVAEVSSTTND
ncbi:histone acetyltransferase [Caenorhabditis elegans]|uniref:histone acetyltransferase n=1 Tax=Caenorhabditis elegans TaxID=6239 RepID=B6VQ95_CAEEL|nr:histone acetyltransferase [Caenorhabditis elegans]CAR97863.1 histone acetyltransferase [Caenorhabditis elegans]|eukprot:NP_001255185.1 Uncharacterized protein CELE_ZK1010.10 [Caenorhabditis elegans]